MAPPRKRLMVQTTCALLAVLSARAAGASITLVASDADGSPWDGFSYPRLVASANGPAVCAHPSVLGTNPEQTGVATGAAAPLQWLVKTGGFTPAPFTTGQFDDISDYDCSAQHGGVAFLGSVGDFRKLTCAGSSDMDRVGYLPRRAGVPVLRPHLDSRPARPQAGIFRLNANNASALEPVAITDQTPLPPTGLPLGWLDAPAIGDTGSTAWIACAKANVSVMGIYTKAAAPGSPVRRMVDRSMSVDGTGTGPLFHEFFGVSLAQTQAAFTANTYCAASARYECGIFVARDQGPALGWRITLLAGACSKTPGFEFAGFGDAIIAGDTLSFVAQTSDGAEGIYRVDTSQAEPKVELVARAGHAVPGQASLGVLAEFPQPPSINPSGQLMFRAYTSSGDTGIFTADKTSGRLSKLVSTLDLIEAGNRTIVYMGSAESALASNGAYTFYASTVDASGKDPRDGVYLAYP